MSGLFPSLELRTGESPASFLSRLALLHRAQSLNVFALDMGFQHQHIVDGDRAALARLAAVSGAPVEQLFDQAIVRKQDHYLYRGQTFARSSLRRARVMACPRCLAEDLDGGVSPWQVSGRSDWLFHHCRVCALHQVQMVEVARASGAPTHHDFARRVAPALSRISVLAEQAVSCCPTQLEQYLDARKRSAAGPEWLDTMPFYAAWRTCEVIGAVALHGRDARLRELSDDNWREAGASGFVVASGGPQKIREFLQGLWLADSQRSRSAGPWTRFGQFFRWLRTTKDDPNFDLVRDVVLDFVADTAPVGPEDELFGRQIVQERRLHSVFTAHRASGLHYKRLRRVLRGAGVLPSDSNHLNDSLVVFPASKAEPVIDLLQHAITLKQAESYLNAGRVHTRLLEKHGFIQSIKGSAVLELGDAAYDRRHLDAFMEQLSAKAIAIAELGRSQLPIAAAAKRACCSSMEIVRLILDHRLGWVGQLSDEAGFKSLVVNLEEVRTFTRGELTDDLNVSQAADALGSTYRVISTLTKNKLLASKRAINPMNRCPYVVVSRAVLEEFKVMYVSLHELARSRRAGRLKLRRQLSEIGILPAFDPSQSAATFYLRSEIPIAF